MRNKYMPSTLPQCCLNRMGMVKVKYDTEAKANSFAQKFKEKHGGRVQIAYQCSSGTGWHLKKKR